MNWKNSVQLIDASSIIHAWDFYPKRQFPPLWNWIEERIRERHVVMPEVAFQETSKFPDCHTWLKDSGLHTIPRSNEIYQDALRIKGLIGIINDEYNPKGVDENDLLIIATARIHRHELISNENRQISLPNERKKFKIPAVCGIESVNVICINFIEYIKRSDRIFG